MFLFHWFIRFYTSVHKETIRTSEDPKITPLIENFKTFPSTNAAFEHWLSWPCCLKAFNKAFNPDSAHISGLDILHVTHCFHSLHFSPVTGGTCCERWNTMLLELYPRVDYVSPHSLKDGWMWIPPPQHLEFHPSCFVKCSVCLCILYTCSDKVETAKVVLKNDKLVSHHCMCLS